MIAVAPSAPGQGTAFTYQGRLSDSGAPANGNYDLQFYLRDAPVAGNPAGVTNRLAPVTVSSGLFTVTLDFGANIFDGSARWLEIGVRTNGSAGGYTVLAPRQPLTPTPYAVRSRTAISADTATSATQLGGFAANQFVQTTDTRLSDVRPPAAGSSNYIQNTATFEFATTQENSSFSISGNGTVGGFLSAYNGVLGISSTGSGNGVSGLGNGSGVHGYSGSGYGVSGESNGGTGVYGTSDGFPAGPSPNYGVYGLVTGGTGNAGVYGKSIVPNGTGVLGQANSGKGVVGQSTSGTGVYGRSDAVGVYGTGGGNGVIGESTAGTGVWGKAAQGFGVVGESTAGTGVRGVGDDSSGYGVYGKSTKGTAVRGLTDTGRAVDGLASNGGVGVYGNNLGSNTKGYAGYFFGRVALDGAIQVPGAGVGTGTAAFIHVITAANLIGASSIIDHPLLNGDPNAILIITARLGVFTDIPRYGVAYGVRAPGRWEITLKDPDTVIGGSFNVLVIKP